MRIRKSALKTIPLILALLAATAPEAPAQDAASGITLEQVLKEIASFDGGIDSAPFWKLRDHVRALRDPAARGECEKALLAFLSTKATAVAKMAVCRELRLIGGDASVPVLRGLLLDPQTADMALYALEKIPGAAADRALIEILGKTEGDTRIAVIQALGARRCADAVPPLEPLLRSGGPIAGSAALALGEIGGDRAAAALAAAYPEFPLSIRVDGSSVRRPGDAPAGAAAVEDPRFLAAAAIMRCAEARTSANNLEGAAALYDLLLADPALPVSLRQGVLAGKIATAGPRAQEILFEHLRGSDAGMREVAIAAVRSTVKPEGIGAVCNLLPGLAPNAQVQLLAALSGYPADRVRPAVLQAARSESPAVRLAALDALAAVGDSSNVPFLAGAAALARGPEQAAARSALARLKGQPVDEAVLAMLRDSAPEDLQIELLLAVGERRQFAAKSAVIARLASESSRVRQQALKTTRVIGTPSDMTAVLELMLKSADEVEIAEVEATAAALAQKIARPDGRAGAVRTMLGNTKDAAGQARLYAVLGRIGDDGSLPQLRGALTDRNPEIVDAAVRALAAWPTPAARDDLAQLARGARSESHRLLALQGLLRSIGAERYRRPEAVVADLKQASALIARPEEKRLVLGLLPRFGCREALALAEALGKDKTVRQEAQAAINKINAQLQKK